MAAVATTDRCAAASGWSVREPQTDRADLATRGAGSIGRTGEAGPALANGRVLNPTAAGARESALGLRPRGVPDRRHPQIHYAMRNRMFSASRSFSRLPCPSFSPYTPDGLVFGQHPTS